MPIDIYEHYRPKIDAIAREHGIPEEIIEPKSIKYGTEYSFPANMHYELEEGGVRMYKKFAAYMTEKYEETITQAIAAEAKKEGCTKAAILDKWKIVKALAAANPEDFPDMVKVVRCKDCKYYAAMITDTVSGDMETAPWGICTQPWFNSDEYDVQENGYCSYGKRKMDKEE